LELLLWLLLVQLLVKQVAGLLPAWVPLRLGKAHSLLVMERIGVYLLLVLGVEQQYLAVMEPSGVHLLVLVLGVQHQSVREPLCPHPLHFRINTISFQGS
jgi:hypothetical protein